jgi:hypothetical protein
MALTKLKPQFLQNFASAGLLVPQLGQTWVSGFPQFWQKRASSGLMKEQFKHFIV